MDDGSRNLRDDAIAKEVAYGLTPTDVARLHGLTPTGVSAILQRDHVKARVEDYREMYQTKLRVVQAEALLLADYAVDVIREALTAPGVSMRDKLAAAKWIIEPMLTSWGDNRSTSSHQGDTATAREVVDKLAAAIDKLAATKSAHEVDITPSNGAGETRQ